MGEITEMLLSGLLCEACGALVDGDEPGYPRRCVGCPPLKRRHAQSHRQQPPVPPKPPTPEEEKP